ncbi:MAG TPA: ABC transporter permease [Vicinamibacterales bacterium]|nr:ABC transporter permease [Vicinamibacterales bacterium]
MTRRLTDIICVFRIHLARLRREAGPFVLAAVVFPLVMYMFATAVGATGDAGSVHDPSQRVRFLAGSIVFSLSLTAVSWLGYLLLENRFTGRLKLFATLPLAPSSYILGIVVFALAQAAIGTVVLVAIARAFGVRTALSLPVGGLLLGAVLVLTVLCVCGIGVIIAARARSFSEGSLLTDALGAGLVFLAPIYCAPEALPRPLQILSKALPTTYAARGVQTTLLGGTGVATELLALTVMAAATLAVGFRVMRWRED